MEVVETRLEGPLLLAPAVHADERGFFLESWRAESWAAVGVDSGWAQDNHSRSASGVVRGIHFAVGAGQAKLIRCGRGSIFDVVVDLRRESSTFGCWDGHELSDDNHRQLFIPVGFGHGFAVTSAVADVLYKCSTPYDPALERGIRWDDPDVAVEWPVTAPIVSERDRGAPLLADIAAELPF